MATFEDAPANEFEETAANIAAQLANLGPTQVADVITMARRSLWGRVLESIELRDKSTPAHLREQAIYLRGIGRDMLGVKLLEMAPTMPEFAPGDIPLLAIPRRPITQSEFDTMLQHITFHGRAAYTFLNFGGFRDEHSFLTPDAPYMIQEVELSFQPEFTTARQVVDTMSRPNPTEGRRPLTLQEGISLLMHHPWILDYVTGVAMPATRHDGYAVDIYRYANGAKLKREPASDYIDPNWLVPTCSKEVIKIKFFS